MAKRLFIAVSFLFVFIGCRAAIRSGVVIFKDIPEQPTFTVIPSAQSPSSQEFANLVESALLHLGMRVFERPAFKALLHGQGELRSDAGGTLENSLDYVEMYKEAKSDFIVMAHGESDSVRVIERSTLQVLAESSTRGGIDDAIGGLLKAQGFIAPDLKNELTSFRKLNDDQRELAWQWMNTDVQIDIVKSFSRTTAHLKNITHEDKQLGKFLKNKGHLTLIRFEDK